MHFIDKGLQYGYTTFATMNTTTIHIKTDVRTRDTAKKVAANFGFTLTSLVNAMLKQIARTKRLTLSLDETPNQYMMEALKRSLHETQSQRGKKPMRGPAVARGREAKKRLAS